MSDESSRVETSTAVLPEEDLLAATPMTAESGHGISFREAFRTWVKVGLYSFGGPAGQIAVMHRILVEQKKWVSEGRFLHALNYCMLLPGPEAQQLATYIGWLLHGTAGGLVAGLLFILPGFVSILALSLLYAGLGDVPVVEALFFGLKAAVLAVVVEAVIRIGRRALRNRAMVTVAALAFVAIFFFEVPFPVIVIGAGIVGLLGGRLRPDLFLVIKGHEVEEGTGAALTDAGHARRPSWRAALGTASIWLALWFTPLALIAAVAGASSIWMAEGVFFSKAAVVTFGGAYAVLAYIAQQAVETYGWLRPGEMLDGLGMAETTPGPLIQVVQFVGFMGAYRHADGMDPMAAGFLGSVLTTWVTFVPCFLFIFVGAPWIEHLRGNQALTAALSGITAAVVGVVLNLSVWFSLHVLFAEVGEVEYLGARLLVPEWGSVDVASLLIAVGAFVALFRFKLGMMWTLAVAVVVGLVHHLFLRG
jgi:chromate transporter